MPVLLNYSNVFHKHDFLISRTPYDEYVHCLFAVTLSEFDLNERRDPLNLSQIRITIQCNIKYIQSKEAAKWPSRPEKLLRGGWFISCFYAFLEHCVCEKILIWNNESD